MYYWDGFLNSVANLEPDQINELRTKILAITANESNFQSSIHKIIEFVSNNTIEVPDPVVVLLPTIEEFISENYTPTTINQIYYSPLSTLSQGYGDSDDINTFLYTMLNICLRHLRFYAKCNSNLKLRPVV